jgi:hypothetical protein
LEKGKPDLSFYNYYWTSASSVGCRRDFGWCASNEMLDYDALNISVYNTLNAWNPSNLCLVVKLLDRDPTRIAFNFQEIPCEIAAALVNTICEVTEKLAQLFFHL